MKFVQPIRDRKNIFDLLRFLKQWNRNYYVAAAIGINWGLRCSDILSITIGDVLAESTAKRVYIRSALRVIELKNKHERIIPISRSMAQILKEHIAWLGYPDIPKEAPLVLSRNYKHTASGNVLLKPLSRQRLWAVIAFAAQELGITEIGTHSLRKTYVWQAWANGVSLDVIRKELGHSSIEITERYAAIPLSATRKVYEKVNFALPPSVKAKRGKRVFRAKTGDI